MAKKVNYSAFVNEVEEYVQSQVEMAKKDMAIEACTAILKDVDGETMQAIVQMVGMEQQLLKQLLMSMTLTDINYAMMDAGYPTIKK